MAASEESYMEVISEISTYIGKLEESIEALRSAANECVENTDEDPAAVASNERLNQAIGKIEDQKPVLQQVIQAMNEELERIREAARRAQNV